MHDMRLRADEKWKRVQIFMDTFRPRLGDTESRESELLQIPKFPGYSVLNVYIAIEF